MNLILFSFYHILFIIFRIFNLFLQTQSTISNTFQNQLNPHITDKCSFFVRFSSFFSHRLFTNFRYHKTIKNNNLFLIDFFHTFLSFKKPAFIGWLFYFIWNFFCISFLPHSSTSFRWARFLALFVKLLLVTTMALSAL